MIFDLTLVSSPKLLMLQPIRCHPAANILLSIDWIKPGLAVLNYAKLSFRDDQISNTRFELKSRVPRENAPDFSRPKYTKTICKCPYFLWRILKPDDPGFVPLPGLVLNLRKYSGFIQPVRSGMTPQLHPYQHLVSFIKKYYRNSAAGELFTRFVSTNQLKIFKASGVLFAETKHIESRITAVSGFSGIFGYGINSCSISL